MLQRASIAFVLIVVFIPTLGAAQSVELTPFIGFRFEGELDDLDTPDSFDFDESDSLALALSFALGPQSFIEVMLSRQETELEDDGFFFDDDPLFEVDVDYWHVGGLYQWNIGHVKPFLAGSLGVTRFEPGPPELDSETRFSLSLGGGAKLMLNRHVGFRFEGRGYATFIDSDSEVFCDAFRCRAFTDSSIFLQVEARAGLVIAF